jgi:hypothetical protein
MSEAVWPVWKRTDTPEVNTLAREREKEADAHDSALVLSEVLYLAFEAGYQPAAPGK